MKTYLIALTIFIAMVATACGDDGGSGASTSAPTDERGQQIVGAMGDHVTVGRGCKIAGSAGICRGATMPPFAC